MLRKIRIFIKLHWGKLLIGGIYGIVVIWMAIFMSAALQDFSKLESFSRRQLSAQMGYFLLIGIFSAFIQLPMFFTMYYFLYSGAMFNIGKGKMKKASVNVKWSEVIGMEGAKKEAWEVVKLMKDRHLVKAIGGKIIKGVMMFGPPGCGKTYLAKAIATECGMPFIPATGSDFIGMFVGQGTAAMKNLFKQARGEAEMHGGCIIFIDEIDSFARPRQADMGFGGTMSNNSTINQFLTEMDGLRQTENNIVVIAATNVVESDLDSAVMRAGRFDRKIYVTRPNLKERKEVFDFYLSKVAHEDAVDSTILARKTLWFSPADIENMLRESSLIASRDSREKVSMKDLSEAYDRIQFGMKSNLVMTQKEKEWTSYHEAGHALIAYLHQPDDDVIKASIVPRRGSLGMVVPRPKEELYCLNRNQLIADIQVSLAAYAAEKIKFGTTSQGVGGAPGSDFWQAMNTAAYMVKNLGMGKSGLLGDFSALQARSAFYSGEFPVSEKTKEVIDADIQDILNSCMREVEKTILANRELFEYFANELLRKEELEYDEIEAIFQKFGIKPATHPQI